MTLAELPTNATLINQRIKTVFNGPSKPSDGIDRAIGWGMDAAYMDFVQLSFSIFGKTLESLCRGFYLLLVISIMLFVIQFVSRPIALLTSTSFAYAFFFLVDYIMLPLELIDNTPEVTAR
jgi:hypothetical protein